MHERVHITVDKSQVDKELNRLLGAPDMKTTVAFNALFAEITAEVMAIIHVETGSLKSTARWDVDPFPSGWQGTVHVGGAAPGAINDPAYYGVYELARGGSHFFFAPAYAEIPAKMTEIILDFYAGGDAKMAEQATAPTPGGGGLKTLGKSFEGTSRHEIKKGEKKVKSRLEKDAERFMAEEDRKDEKVFPTSGTSGEGLKRRSDGAKAAKDVERERKPEREKSADGTRRIKPHKNTRRRRR